MNVYTGIVYTFVYGIIQQVYLPAFFVAFDHKMKAVVIAIKGTTTFSVCWLSC